MKEIDELTIRRAAKKDAQAFKRVYDHYAGFVWKVIFRTVNGDAESAKEIVQETFVRVYSSLKSFSYNSALSTWLYRVAFNVANTYLKKNKKSNRVLGVDIETVIDTKTKSDFESEELVELLLKMLSAEERFLLTSREVEGIPFEDLAEITGKSSESLRTQVSRVKDKLRASFERLNAGS